MTVAEMFLKIAQDEAQTLYEYQGMLNTLEDELDDNAKSIVDEIMGDEFNHCLVALLSAKEILGIKIATDGIEPNPNDIEVEEDDDSDLQALHEEVLADIEREQEKE